MVRVLTAEKNLLRDLVIFTLILFTPVGFTAIGTRIYRNAAMTPLYFTVLSMMTLMFVWHFIKPKITQRLLIAFNIAFGLIFTLTCYIKEDGLWLVCCLITVTIICLVKIIFDRTEIFKRVSLLLIPLMIFASGTVAYKTVNKIFFGVYLINNRTEGELGNFQKLIYKIKSDERRANIWAPTDALAQAFNASETLRQNSALKDAIWHTGWFSGDIEKNPIQGDFLGWVMLSELYNSGTCKNLVEQEEFLAKVNRELQAAFDAGILQKDNRFQLISSMGGMTNEEIFSLGKLMLTEYYAHITLNLQKPEREVQSLEHKRRLKRISNAMNMNLAKYATEVPQTIESFLKILFGMYSVIQTIFFFAALIGVVLSLCAINKKIFSTNEYLMIAIAVGNLLLSIVYALAIAWFSEFLFERGEWGGLIFYSSALVPMLLIFGICGTCLLYRIKGIKDKG